MGDALETRPERVLDHLRRPVPGRRNLLTEDAGNTVSETVPVQDPGATPIKVRKAKLLFVGDNWAEDHHDVELQDDSGRVLVRRRLPEGIMGIAGLHGLVADHLVRREGAGEGQDQDDVSVVVGIETDRGPCVEALIAAGYRVSAINLKQASRFKERYGASGAESDKGDAHALADMVRIDRAQLRPVAGDTSSAQAIKVVARTHQTMVVNGLGTNPRNAATAVGTALRQVANLKCSISCTPGGSIRKLCDYLAPLWLGCGSVSVRPPAARAVSRLW